MTIKVLTHTPGCLPQIIRKGDWIDLYTAQDVSLSAPYAKMLHKHKNGDRVDRIRDVMLDSALIPLGVSMRLPSGFEAVVVPRSSTFKKTGLLQTNSVGVIDNSFKGNDDQWQLPVVATRSVTVPKGTRLCQFRIQLSQKATFFQKLRWLLSSKIRIKSITNLSSQNRSGFGSTGD